MTMEKPGEPGTRYVDGRLESIETVEKDNKVLGTVFVNRGLEDFYFRVAANAVIDLVAAHRRGLAL